MNRLRGVPDSWRPVVGAPWLWQGLASLALAATWFALGAFSEPTAFRAIIGILWSAVGAVQTVVAVSDRRHGRGRYARR